MMDLYDIIEHCTGRRPTSDADELRDARGDWITWLVEGRIWGYVEAAYELKFGYIVLDGWCAWHTVGDVRECIDRLLWQQSNPEVPEHEIPPEFAFLRRTIPERPPRYKFSTGKPS